jgi:pimeloyl-ACP methyl ester carboxylesterase
MAKAIPGAKLAIIPNAGHLPPLEQPEAFNRHLAALLDRVKESLPAEG